MYKIGDKVEFTFLGEPLVGVIIEKVSSIKWKVKGNNGTTYPFIYGKEPVKKKGVKYEAPLGVIIRKLGK